MTLFAALRLPGEILFGKGQRHALPAVAGKLGKTALICTDERFAGTDVFGEMKCGLEIPTFNVRSGSEMTATGVASEPVPAVVGTAISGMVGPGTLNSP